MPDDSNSKPKVTCYSHGEGEWMRQSQELRGKWLAPFLQILDRLKINANHLTFFSLLTGLAFCPFFLLGYKALSFGLLLAHVILDGLDGPLARMTGRASNKGSFTDTMSDQVVVAFTMVTLIHAKVAGAWPGGLYVFFYTMVVIFAMVRNALTIPYSWLFRPRFLVYAWFLVEVYLLPGTLDYLLWGVTAVLAVKMVSGFVRIRRKM